MIIESVFVHDPIRLLAMGCSSLVENKGLSHPYPFEAGVDDLITAGGFPKPSSRRTIGTGAGRVFLIFVAEEVPVILWGGSDLALL